MLDAHLAESSKRHLRLHECRKRRTRRGSRSEHSNEEDIVQAENLSERSNAAVFSACRMLSDLCAEPRSFVRVDLITVVEPLKLATRKHFDAA